MGDAAAFLRAITGFLSECDIAFMVTGSFVSSFYGDPRTTRDLDLIVDAKVTELLQRALEN
jgi:hypothetical protein